MKLRQCYQSIAATLLFFLILSSCTSNPFGDDDISGGNRKISGKVQLSNNLNPEGVFVWLEGLNIGTKTDAQGTFQLILPPPSSQSSGGISGVFNIYFYMDNFDIVTKPVAVGGGLFVYSQGELNNSGEFFNAIFLFQSLSIETVMMPNIVAGDTGSVISAWVTLQAMKDTVTVFYPRTVTTAERDFLAPLLFRNVITNEVFIIEFVLAGLGFSDFIDVTVAPITRQYVTGLSPGLLPVGKYEVIPYLFTAHDNLPNALLKTIGQNVEELGADYLKIPFIREGGQFEVK
ncbi:MAG: hypothetical protein E2O79_03135 [Caldithrix sp.]|nr:MAG: hypothetical protein E2O79_03135 [Caldithrix sp.]